MLKSRNDMVLASNHPGFMESKVPQEEMIVWEPVALERANKADVGKVFLTQWD